uniref:1-phosphatidylinositol-3-phosphate 5-kinase n=1 Tax=Glossina brevipalpis TaxID=37001 RepID=A0A1A9W6H5_9MUSC
MNQNLHSLTKLTEFARDFEEQPDTLLSRFVNKIQHAYNQSYNAVNDISSYNQQQQQQQQQQQIPNITTSKSVFYNDSEAADNHQSIVQNNHPSTCNILPGTFPDDSLTIPNEISSSTTNEDSNSGENLDSLSLEHNEGRTTVNVLIRLRNLVASKNNDLRNYKDTDLHRFWMPDSKAKECYDCAQKFSTFRRKHHCRLCGQIFCSKCCNQVVSGKIIKCSGDLKVCNYCSKIVLSYLRSPNITKDLNSDLQALQQNLSGRLETKDENESSPNLSSPQSPMQRKISVGYQEERFAIHQPHITMDDRKNILQQSSSLIALLEEMRQVLPAQNCGLDLIQYLNMKQKTSNKMQALAILSAMLEAGFIHPIVHDSEQTEFDENLHYRFATELPRQTIDTINFNSVNQQTDNVISPQFEQFGNEPHPPNFHDAAALKFKISRDVDMDNAMHSTASKLLESYCDHEEQLIAQMLRTFQLDLQWSKILNPLCCRAANHFKPEYCTNELMDIRNFVNFKKIAGGKRVESSIVGGVVFSKNVAHKEMATRVEQPRILLLQCPIVYERIEGKFVSISTVLLQEKEYLRHVCARIMSFKPNVVLVHKNVAGVAQDMLRSHGITLVLDVKLSVMDRLARTLQCDVLTNIEGNIAQPKLGICDAFYIRNYNDGNGSTKTLMFFEKLANPRGFTCLLRGGNNKELAKVKKIASFLVYARYNWRLEMSFLLDEYAEALTPKPPIFDSKETSPADENANINKQTTSEEENLMQSAAATAAGSTPSKRAVILERKSEEKIFTTVTDVSHDFSDPLRSTSNSKHNEQSPNLELEVEHRYDNRFRSALSSTILSVSPFLSFPLPFLETEQGRKCLLRSLFPAELYYSKLWSSTNFSGNVHSLERGESSEITPRNKEEIQLNPPHPFHKLKITAPVDNYEIQTLLAEFRAYGGRYPKKPEMFKMLKQYHHQTTTIYQNPQKMQEDIIYKDVLDIENHQRLPVLFCSFFYNQKGGASSFCAPPTLLDMKFYGNHDIMLSQFLHRYCFRTSCNVCNLPMKGHIRRYVHSMGCIKVFLSEDNAKFDANNIYFTAWCSKCKEVTPTVALAESSKCLSLAKYLELRFYGHGYKKRALIEENSTLNTNCSHSLHRDYIHQFSYRGAAARFQYTPIETWEISFPALTISLHPPITFNRFEVLEEVKNFSMKGHEVYTRIHERIADLATEDENSPLAANLKMTLSKDQFIFKQHMEIIQTLLTENRASCYDITDALLTAKRVLAESIECWEPRLHEIVLAQKNAVKQSHDSTQQHHVDSGTICTEELLSEHLEISPTTAIPPPSDIPLPVHSEELVVDNNTTNAESAIVTSPNNLEKSGTENHFTIPQITNSSDKKTIKKMLNHLLPSTGPVNLLQSPFNIQEHYTLPLGAFPVIVHDLDLSSVIAYSLTCGEYKHAVNLLSSQTNNVQTYTTDNTSISNAGGVNPSPHVKRKSQECHESDECTKENNTVFSGDDERTKSKSNSHIEVSFQDNSVQFTCKIYFAQEFDQMRSKTLKAPKLDKSVYREIEQSKKREELKISQSRNGPEIELIRKVNEINTNNEGNDIKSEEYNHQKEEVPKSIDIIEESRNYFARSLCSSVQWEAKGGKSGSRFCKTSDDRFVLKEMSKNDVNIFEIFAPNYFDYINKCQQQNQPTLLAKIFGVFKVIIKKKDSTVEKALLVMENLFYECDIKNKFDLKGSERNRLVDPMNQQEGDIVLLDENLVQMSWSKPLYVLTHSKVVLKDAINRDACFLEKNEVMDYSLLVGLDERNGLLVLGIIDYIRTYTFEKRVESFVKKQTGILGGMNKLPTIIAPQHYRQRFYDAMDRYFPTVPDRWEGLSKI